MTESISSAEEDRRKRRKVAAILAGGLVVGIGTMATLAAWTDDEYANGSFTAGTFIFQGSTDNTTWTDHASAPGAALTFTAAPTNMSPGDVYAAPFAVKLGTGTTTGAGVAFSSAAATGGTGLTYDLVQTTTWGCTATTTGTALVTGSALTAGTANFTITTAGTPVYLCFKVKAGATLQQSQASSVTWRFNATSN